MKKKSTSILKKRIFYQFYYNLLILDWHHLYDDLKILCPVRFFSFVKRMVPPPFFFILPSFKKRQLFAIDIFLSFASFCHLHLFSFFLKTQFLFIHACHHPVIHPVFYPIFYPVIHPVIHPVIRPVIRLVIRPVIFMVIWCFPIWLSSFIKLSNGNLQCKFIRTF